MRFKLIYFSTEERRPCSQSRRHSQALSFRKRAQMNDRPTLQYLSPNPGNHPLITRANTSMPPSNLGHLQCSHVPEITGWHKNKSTGEKLKESEEQMGRWEGKWHILTNSYRLFHLSAVGSTENGEQGATEQLGKQMGWRKGWELWQSSAKQNGDLFNF